MSFISIIIIIIIMMWLFLLVICVFIYFNLHDKTKQVLHFNICIYSHSTDADGQEGRWTSRATHQPF